MPDGEHSEHTAFTEPDGTVVHVDQWFEYKFASIPVQSHCDSSEWQCYKDKGARRDLTSDQVSVEKFLELLTIDKTTDLDTGCLRLACYPLGDDVNTL